MPKIDEKFLTAPYRSYVIEAGLSHAQYKDILQSVHSLESDLLIEIANKVSDATPREREEYDEEDEDEEDDEDAALTRADERRLKNDIADMASGVAPFHPDGPRHLLEGDYPKLLTPLGFLWWQNHMLRKVLDELLFDAPRTKLTNDLIKAVQGLKETARKRDEVFYTILDKVEWNVVELKKLVDAEIITEDAFERCKELMARPRPEGSPEPPKTVAGRVVQTRRHIRIGKKKPLKPNK